MCSEGITPLLFLNIVALIPYPLQEFTADFTANLEDLLVAPFICPGADIRRDKCKLPCKKAVHIGNECSQELCPECIILNQQCIWLILKCTEGLQSMEDRLPSLFAGVTQCGEKGRQLVHGTCLPHDNACWKKPCEQPDVGISLPPNIPEYFPESIWFLLPQPCEMEI